MNELWEAVDRYFEDSLVPCEPPFASALQRIQRAGLPAISVAANQGKLLMLLARMVGARRILEVGTLGGYSTLWLARALAAEGRVVTLELEPRHAEVARENFQEAGLEQVVEVRVGQAAELLAAMVGGESPFDLIFIDADKASIDRYFDLSLQLTRVGSIIVMDNVVREGEVADAGSPDPNVQGVRRLIARLANEPRVDATALQTVGVKGYDGLAIARVER